MKYASRISYLCRVGSLGLCLGLMPSLSALAFAQTPPPATKMPPLPPKGNTPDTVQDPSKPKPGEETGGTAQDTGKARVEYRFASEAAEGGMLEVALGRIGLERGSHAEVKEFAQRLIDDHTKANTELRAIADEKQLTLPREAAIEAKLKAVTAKLDGLQGAAFDRAYMEHMVKDHQKDIALFDREASSGSDVKFRDFAKKTLPVLREHLKMAQTIHGKVAGKGTN